MTDDILFERRGAAGIVTLNRPKALNALTWPMVTALGAKLAEWAADPHVKTVVVQAAEGRAFCAGGDIRALYDRKMAGRTDESLAFWRDEYMLNLEIRSFAKPVVALVDGIVMGGGVGVSIHASHCIAGDRFSFAMPEVGIGFFPDVGATWFLPRLPGEIGTWCALTAGRLGQADAVATGLVRAAVPSAEFPALVASLVAGESADEAVGRYAVPMPVSPVMLLRARIDACFAFDDVETILAALDAAAMTGGREPAEWAAAIRAKSPTSLKIALAQMRAGRAMRFAEAMRTEFRIVSRIVDGHDFYEGIRAAILDKDNAPRWRPDSLAGVSAGEVARHFAPLERELPVS